MSTTTTLHNKPVPALRRLWSMFGTGSWDRSTSTPKPKSDDDGRDSRSSASLTQQLLLPARSLKGNVSAVISIVWAFTKNDIFTFSLPVVIFGAALSLAKDARTAPEPPTFNQVLSRLLGSCLFQFISLVLFDVDNQRDPTSVAEDRINKPWRPIPSGMITSDQSRRLVLFLVPVIMALGYALGIWNEALLVIIAAWVYNHLGGGDEPIVREFVLGISYALFQIASLRIALGSGEYHAQTQTDVVADVTSPSGYAWTAITGALIATTIPMQDMKDQEGDRLRPIRKTLPLFIGDTATRYYLAVTIPVWSVVGTVFWGTPGWYAVPIVVYGGYIAWRLLAKRNPVADEASWRNWSRWLMLVYALPAVNALMQ